MITLTREETQQVLDALKNCRAIGTLDEQAWSLATQAIELLRAKLSEPVIDGWPLYSGLPDGVALTLTEHPHLGKSSEYKLSKESLETILLEKEWVGLTDEEIEGAIDEGFAFGLDDGNVSNKYVIRYARSIEAKLKERNT